SIFVQGLSKGRIRICSILRWSSIRTVTSFFVIEIYELEIAHGIYALGDGLSVAETRFGRIGVMVCADGFAPGQCVARSLALMGADIILSPCAWAVPADHDNVREPYGQLWMDNYGPVARDFRIWIA